MNSGGAEKDTGGDLGGSLPVGVCMPVPVDVRCLRCGRRVKSWKTDEMGNTFGLNCYVIAEYDKERAFMAKQLPLIEPYRRQRPPHQIAMERHATTANEKRPEGQLQSAGDAGAVVANAGGPDAGDDHCKSAGGDSCRYRCDTPQG